MEAVFIDNVHSTIFQFEQAKWVKTLNFLISQTFLLPETAKTTFCIFFTLVRKYITFFNTV